MTFASQVQGELIADARGWDGTYGAPHAVDWDGDGPGLRRKPCGGLLSVV